MKFEESSFQNILTLDEFKKIEKKSKFEEFLQFYKNSAMNLKNSINAKIFRRTWNWRDEAFKKIWNIISSKNFRR